MKIEGKKTPFYLVSYKKFSDNCAAIEDAFRKAWNGSLLFGYSVKTNHYPGLIKLAKERGWQAEVVSYDEMLLARELGFGHGQIICNGPVKGQMIEDAIEEEQILNLDHLREIYEVCAYIKKKNISPEHLRIGLRVNFDLEHVCPGETTAGKSVSRFGICYENGDIKTAIDLLKESQISVVGLHMHTSTTSRSLHVFAELTKMVCQIVEEYQLDLKYIDIGGGFFGGRVLQGKPTMTEYADTIAEELKKVLDPHKTTLILEPGAAVLATAVDYVTGVANIREIRGEKIVTLDGTALHINPFMVNRTSDCDVLNTGDNTKEKQHICGCTCMELDRFGTLFNEKELTLDSIIVFHNAGAYTMALNSDFIVKPPTVYDDV